MNAGRGARGAAYVLQTPANRYPSRLPWFESASVVKLVSPRLAPAQFSQQLLSADHDPPRPAAFPADCEQFAYVLSGDAVIRLDGVERQLGPGAYAYCPASHELELAGAQMLRMIRIHRRWSPLPDGRRPSPLHGHVGDCEAADTAVPGLVRRELLPADDPSFDFAMSVMRFAPGVALSQIEIHDEEHGLYMLSGSGRYLLGDDEHDVAAGDFIYMAPYCPQTFVAGAAGAEYLLYKDAFRDLP